MMLQQKPIEWRRFERVQLEGEVAKGSSARPDAPQPVKTPSHSPATTAPSLLHEFERVLRENERLRYELSKLREKAAENKHETSSNREEQRRKRPDIVMLPDLEPAKEGTNSERGPDLSALSAEVAKPAESLAKVVAGYIFDKPTKQNVRLVEDALQARGIKVE